jgi:hypothetical protein
VVAAKTDAEPKARRLGRFPLKHADFWGAVYVRSSWLLSRPPSPPRPAANSRTVFARATGLATSWSTGTLEDGVEVMCRGAGGPSVTAAEVPVMRASRL